jgi:hypothetical protein
LTAINALFRHYPHMQLLSNLAILEYNGKELWHGVNPLIEPIDAFKSAIKRNRPKRHPR